MKGYLKYLVFWICLHSVDECDAQIKDSAVSLQAYRHGVAIDAKTGEEKEFVLCGDHVSADSAHFFSIISGCERNVQLFVGKYSFSNDSFVISPFNFVLEQPFAKIYKVSSIKKIQTITFLSANYKSLNGRDSSWIVRAFKKKKQRYFDFSETGVVKLHRGKFDGIELLQLSKIFGGPVVFFLNRGFDYTIIVNMPEEPLKRFIKGASSITGKAFILKDILYFEGSPDGCNITKDSRTN